ncbi:MAG TPA: transcription termination factor Rho, partial [Alistipes sp.]|nr:transcription termination factor Rho [Alistipes sp.]
KRRGRKPKAEAQAESETEAPADRREQPVHTEPAAGPEPSDEPQTPLDEEVITKDDFAGEIEGEGVLEIMP